MLEVLFNWLSDRWDDLKIIVFVMQYESGIILRNGIYHRILPPGINFKIPFIETALIETTNLQSIPLTSQTIETRDNVSLVVSGAVRYRVMDVKPYLLNLDDAGDILIDTAMGAIRGIIIKYDYIDLNSLEIDKEIKREIASEVRTFGISIKKFTFTDFGKIKTLRLLQDQSE